MILFYDLLSLTVDRYGEKQFNFPRMMPTFENLTDETNISISMKVHTSAMSSVVERKTPHLTC
jgi:hypothetical protein